MSAFEEGKTLRDEFAMAAMAAIISKTPWVIYPNGESVDHTGPTARGAYDYADAMLEARK